MPISYGKRIEGVKSDLFLWAQEQIKRYSYKPGWRMIVSRPQSYDRDDFLIRDQFANLRIDFDAIDARHPRMGRTLKIGAVHALYDTHVIDNATGEPDEKRFESFLIGAIRMMEQHESQEWLRRDGNIVNDPHRSL